MRSFGIRCTAEKAGEQNVVLRRAVGKKRRVPDGAERAESFAAGNQKAKAMEIVGNVGAQITSGDDGNRRVRNAGERAGERRNLFLEKFCGNKGGNRENEM